MVDLEQLISGIGWQQRGGLYVPQTRPGTSDGPDQKPVLSFLREAPGYSDIVGDNLSLEGILDRIHQLPIGYWLKFVAAVTLVCDRDGYVDTTTNERFINTFVHSDYHGALIAWVRHANHGLFSPQTLASLAKLAIANAPETVEQTLEHPLEYIFFTYLAFHDHVQRIVIPEATTDPRATLLRFFVQNGDFAFHPSLLENFVTAWSLLCEQPRGSSLQLSPDEIFAIGTDVSLERFFAMAFAIVGLGYTIDVDSPESMRKSIIVNQEMIFSSASVETPNVERFFERLVLTDDAVQEIKQEDPSTPAFFYDFGAFRETPLYKLNENERISLVYPFFRWRVTGGLYWDIFSIANDHPNYGRKVRDQFSQAFGKYFETYIQGIFVEAFGELTGLAQRIWREPKDTEQAPCADLVIAYPDAFVFIEVKAARPKYEKSMVQGDLAAIEDDLRKMVYEPLCQLNDAIDHFKAGHLAELGLKWGNEAIFPVVITYGSLLYSAILALIEGSECYQKLVNTPACMTPLILDAEEGARLASLVKNGHAITDVLNLKFQSPNDNLSFRTFSLQLFGDVSEPKHVLERKWEALSESIRTTLFNTSEGDVPS